MHKLMLAPPKPSKVTTKTLVSFFGGCSCSPALPTLGGVQKIAFRGRPVQRLQSRMPELSPPSQPLAGSFMTSYNRVEPYANLRVRSNKCHVCASDRGNPGSLMPKPLDATRPG